MVADLDAEALTRLRKISKILGVPVDQFMTRTIPADLLAMDECLRLWSCLKTAKARHRALDALRDIVDSETA